MSALTLLDPAHLPLGFIDGLGGMEMLLVFAVALLLFGGDKLPEFARGIGKVMREVKKAASGVEDEFRRAMDEDERKRLQAAATTPGALESGAAAPSTPVPSGDAYPDYAAHTAAGAPPTEGATSTSVSTEAPVPSTEGGPTATTEPSKPAAKPAPASEDYP